MGRTSGRPNLGRLAEGELAAFSKHSFVVATLLYNNKDILFLEIEKNAFSRKEEKINNFYQNRVHHNSKYYRRCFCTQSLRRSGSSRCSSR